MVSRDRFGRSVQHQSPYYSPHCRPHSVIITSSHHHIIRLNQTGPGAYSRDCPRFPRRHPCSTHTVNPLGHEIGYRWCSLPRLHRHRASTLLVKVIKQERMLSIQVSLLWTNFCAPLFSHIRFWYAIRRVYVWSPFLAEYGSTG